MTSDQQLLTENFFEKLRLFSFFHLGSDAEISLVDEPEGITVSIAHRRVSPFRFSLSWEELRELLELPSAFEDFMLGELMRHRVS